MLFKLHKKILAISLCLPLWVHADDIGSITEHKGSGELTREAGDKFNTALDIGIESYDDVRTNNGRLKIQFVDETNLSLTEHSKIIIDEFVYDPGSSDNRMAITFAQGTARFATGSLGFVPKENISIETPTATIGIRGTDFTTTVDELGRSLVILLPDERTGQSSGEITVTNDGGVVVLNEPFQATMVATRETVPTKPTTLDITVGMIDNMFIVSPPAEIKEVQQEQEASKNESVLDFDADILGYADESLKNDPEFMKEVEQYL